MEYLRADICEFVLTLFADDVLTVADFTISGRGVYLRSDARATLWQALDPFLDKISEEADRRILRLRKRILALYKRDCGANSAGTAQISAKPRRKKSKNRSNSKENQ